MRKYIMPGKDEEEQEEEGKGGQGLRGNEYLFLCLYK